MVFLDVYRNVDIDMYFIINVSIIYFLLLVNEIIRRKKKKIFNVFLDV